MEIGIGTQFAQRRYNTIVQVVEIIGETKTQFVLSNGDRLRKDDLQLVGNHLYNPQYYSITNEADIEMIRRRKIIAEAKSYNLEDFSTHTLERIIAILKEQDYKRNKDNA